MKKMLNTFILGCFILSTGIAYASTPTINWSLGSDAPSTGVSELHFPMAFASTPDASGLYFAFYTTLAGNSRPYTGFQPKPPVIAGEHTFQAIFSSFNADARHDDSNCYYGADGGSGVSCSTRFQAKLGHFYSNRLTATLESNNIYRYTAAVYDDSTNTEVAHIGSFSIPATSGAGLFKIKDQGFIEAYLKPGCSQTAIATYGQVTGYQDGKTYNGNAITGSTPATGSCNVATFKSATDGSALTEVTVKAKD